MSPAVIVEAGRSPMFRTGADLPGGLAPTRILATLIEEVTARSGLGVADVDGLVLIGTASDTSDLPPQLASAACGHEALVHAVRAVCSGENDVVVVAGAQAPPDEAGETGEGNLIQARRAMRAELLAASHALDRRALDGYAERSWRRAVEVRSSGEFEPEIVRLAPADAIVAGDATLAGPLPTAAQLAELGPRFTRPPANGFVPCMITHGNSYRTAGGACAVVVASERAARLRGVGWRARLAAAASAPARGAGGPHAVLEATRRALAVAGVSARDLDHCEVDEAFAGVPLAWQDGFGVNADLVNPRGGAISLGHLGNLSALRSLVTMLRALEDTGGATGVQVSDDCHAAHALVLRRHQPRRATPWRAMPYPTRSCAAFRRDILTGGEK